MKKKSVTIIFLGLIVVLVCLWFGIPRSLESITGIRKDEICLVYGHYLLQHVEDGKVIEDSHVIRLEASDENEITKLWDILKNGTYKPNIRNIVPIIRSKEIPTTLYVVFQTADDAQVRMCISFSGKVYIDTDTASYRYTASDSEVYDNLILFIKENHSD